MGIHPAILRRRGGGSRYGVLGSEPPFVAGFGREYYRANSARDTFANVITHAATSNATMVDSDGLLKWAPHNLLTYSEDFSNVAWTKSGLTAPSATRIEQDGSSGFHRISQALTLDAGAECTLDVVASADEENIVGLSIYDGSSFIARATFDLNAGVVDAVNDGTAYIEAVGGGEYLCRVSGTASGTSGQAYISSGSVFTFTGTLGAGLNVERGNLYRSDLGGMAPVPPDARVAGSTTYVPTTSTAKYLPRRHNHVYDGSAWVDAGTLIETEARTNLLAYSDDFTNAAWVYTGTSDEAKDADGYTPIIESPTSLGHYLLHDASVTSGVTYTFSFDVKARENTLVQIASSIGFGADYINFDLSSGTIGSGGMPATITKIGSGEYRVSASATAISTTSGRFVISLTPDDVSGRLPNYTGISGNGILIRRVQHEAGSTPSSYIPTNGSTATRAAETLTAPSANLPWGSAVSIQMEGLETFADEGSATQELLFDWRADANNRITLALDTDSTKVGTLTLTMVNGGSSATISTTAELTPGVNAPFNVAFVCTSNELGIALDGTAETRVSHAIGLPDLSAEDATFGGNGTRDTARLWATDLGDTGIAEAST